MLDLYERNVIQPVVLILFVLNFNNIMSTVLLFSLHTVVHRLRMAWHCRNMYFNVYFHK